MIRILKKLKDNIFSKIVLSSGTSGKLSRQGPCASCTPACGTTPASCSQEYQKSPKM